MFEIYKELNDNSKKFLIEELEKKTKDNCVLERCYKEIDLLYANSLLPVIECLYIYKNDNKNIKYYFTGMTNNLLILFVLGISEIDPVKYELDYELYDNQLFGVYFVNSLYTDFLDTVEVVFNDFRFIEGGSSNLNNDNSNHYLLIPCYYKPTDLIFRLNNKSKFETIEDFKNYLNKYLIVNFGEIWPFVNMGEIKISNVIRDETEKEWFNKIKPKTFDDYVKVKCLSKRIIKKNAATFFYERHNKKAISNRDDLFNYLIKFGIDKDTSVTITNFTSKGKANKNEYKEKWNKYVDLLKNHKCPMISIRYFENICYLTGKGEIIEECILSQNKDCYVEV